MTYAVKLTPLATGAVSEKSSAATLIEHTRGVIAELVEGGTLSAPLNLIFHRFAFADIEFICYSRDGVIEVDTCSEKTITLEKGPLAGKPVVLPVPDSE
jgi:hypothetical protein